MQFDIKTILAIGLYTAAFTFVFERMLIKSLSRINAVQAIRDEAPASHKGKAGTPTMGGAAFIASLIISVLLIKNSGEELPLMVIVTTAFGAVGLWDDWIKVTKKHNLGLRAWQKMGLLLIFAAGFAVWEYTHGNTSIFIPYVKISVDLGVWSVPVIILVCLATTNAVNLTDGLDGLASSVTAVVSLTFAMLCWFRGCGSGTVYSVMIAGVCLSFLVYNRYPAKVFMGDTGSLALGGALAAISVVSGLELALIVAGGIYVAEALSVIIQVFVFKTQNGRRFFRMAPLHHHLELGGMSENKIVVIFVLISIALGIIIIPGVM